MFRVIGSMVSVMDTARTFMPMVADMKESGTKIKFMAKVSATTHPVTDMKVIGWTVRFMV